MTVMTLICACCLAAPAAADAADPARAHTARDDATRRVHDPVMIRAADAWYLFSTGPGVPIRRSRDLVHWEHIGRVFPNDVPAWAHKEIPHARDVWAPDISHHSNRYHLYYSVSTMGSQRSCIGLATNKTLDPSDPDYAWTDHGKVLESFPHKMDHNAIDPNLVIDAEGQPWLAWGSYWGGIKLVRLDLHTGKPKPGDTTIHHLAARPRHHAIEAPFITRHGDHYYLFVSFDRCCLGVASNYRIMVGRSRDITGPYLDFNGQPMLAGHATLVLAGYDTCRGPGHNGLARDPTGDWLVHHMYDAAAGGLRTLQVRPLIWGPNGWPVVGEPLADPVDTSAAPTTRPRPLQADDLHGIWRHAMDFRAETYHVLLPDGRIKSPADGATWSLENGFLELRWPDPNAPGRAWIDQCHLAPDGASYVGRNQQGRLIRGRR